MMRWAGAVSQLAGVSAYIIDLFADFFPHAEKHVVRNPVVGSPSEKVSRRPQTRLKSIGYIGGLDPIKGVGMLLGAAPVLAELGCEVHIAGDGRLADEVAACAERLPFVFYHGIVSGAAKEEFLGACDAGIVPSIWAEPGGPTHTMVEWLCSGRPVLVSRAGGLGEVVDLYPGAFAVEPTIDGIIGAVAELSEPAKWQSVRSQVRPIDGSGALDHWISTYEDIYRSMV
jgi:glycosyltransferase involved in cell wall biosynthesis